MNSSPPRPYVGVDEAGRGPAMGPVVVGMVVWTGKGVPDDLPLRDSKKLSPSVRRKAARRLEQTVRHRVLSIPAWCLARESLSLPQLEARVILRGLREFPGVPAVCDLLENGDTSHDWLRHHDPRREFVFEPKAEDAYPGVAAASILAKVHRDRAMEAIGERFGEVGSGYPSDPSTRDWLKRWSRRDEAWPSFVRTGWSTVRRLEESVT